MDVRATDCASGVQRRAFTNADIRRMVETGVIGADERFELLRGDIAPMAPEYGPATSSANPRPGATLPTGAWPLASW